jgi:hypothetical protein
MIRKDPQSSRNPCEVWTDGRRHVVLYEGGTLAQYEGESLVWFQPGSRRPPRATRARWRAPRG